MYARSACIITTIAIYNYNLIKCINNVELRKEHSYGMQKSDINFTAGAAVDVGHGNRRVQERACTHTHNRALGHIRSPTTLF